MKRLHLKLRAVTPLGVYLYHDSLSFLVTVK